VGPAPAAVVDELNAARGAHLLSLLGFVFPFANVIAPLVVWQTGGRTSAFVEQHARESLNFQISMTIYYSVATLLVFVLVGLLLLPALVVVDVVFVIQQSNRVGRGEPASYPLSIRLVS